MTPKLRIIVGDPDPIASKNSKHALKFKTTFDEHSASSSVVHLSDEELFDTLNAILARIQEKFLRP